MSQSSSHAAIATQRVKFSPEEDEKLKSLFKKFGSNWKIISIHMGSRTPRQCRTRYQNYLAPGYFNGEWTKEEDELLLEKFKLFGSQWKEIKKYFPARTANALKNRWNYYTSKHEYDISVKKNTISHSNALTNSPPQSLNVINGSYFAHEKQPFQQIQQSLNLTNMQSLQPIYMINQNVVYHTQPSSANTVLYQYLPVIEQIY